MRSHARRHNIENSAAPGVFGIDSPTPLNTTCVSSMPSVT